MSTQLQSFVGWLLPDGGIREDGQNMATKQSTNMQVLSGDQVLRCLLMGKPAYRDESIRPNVQYLVAVGMSPENTVELTIVSYRVSRFASVGHIVTIEVIS